MDQALDDFLTVMNMHVPNVVPSTKYLFYKKFSHKAFTQHFFCPDCSYYFGPIHECDPNDTCSCVTAKSGKCQNTQLVFFLLECPVTAGTIAAR